VTIQPLTEELAQSFDLKQAKGALVNSIIKGSPADKAGMLQGDVITSLNGAEVKDPSHLQRLVAEAGVGKTAKVTVFREGKSIELNMTLASADSAPKQRRESGGERQGGGEADLLGLVIEESGQGGGVVVVDALKGGIAAEAGIRRGDVIVSINRKRVTNKAEYARIIQQADQSGGMTLLVRRGEASIYFALRTR
jgi:S1-C subfamily serine protease